MTNNKILITNDREVSNPINELLKLPLGMERPTVSVVIPTLNEAHNLPLLLPFLPMDWIDEVILVDGRSTDNTIEVARRFLPSIKIVLETTKGKGAAMRAGYRATQTDIVILLDADGSNDPREIPRYVKALMDGANFVKGSRFATGGGTTDMPRIRKLGNLGFVIISNLLFSVKFTDLCYGMHGFWRYCLDELDFDSFDGFEIDAALYLQAVRKKLHLVEVPSFEGVRFHGEGKLQTFPDGFRVLKTILSQWIAKVTSPEPEHYLGFRGLNPNNVKSDLQSIRLLGLVLATGLRLENALTSLLQLALQQVGAASASIIVLDEQGVPLEFRTTFNNGKVFEPANNGYKEVVEDGLVGWVLRNRQPALVESTLDDPRWLQRDWDRNTQVARSAIALPLILHDQILGVITLANDGAGRFSESDVSALQKMAQLA